MTKQYIDMNAAPENFSWTSLFPAFCTDKAEFAQSWDWTTTDGRNAINAEITRRVKVNKSDFLTEYNNIFNESVFEEQD